jgi:hypothetical protein
MGSDSNFGAISQAMNLNAFVQGNLALVLGALALVGVMVGARLSEDDTDKRDLGVGARWLGIFLVLRLNGFWIEALVPDEWHPYLRVS